jgi:hypothetical protein
MVILESSRKMIERCDPSLLVEAIEIMQTQRGIRNCYNLITLIFTGYDDDPRDLHYIPEVRRYVQELEKKFRNWFYFFDKSNEVLKVLTLCVCRVIREDGGAHPHPEDFQKFLYFHFVNLNELCEKHDISLETIDLITNDIRKYYNLF